MWLGEQITERGLGNGNLDPDLLRHRRRPATAIGGLFELVRTRRHRAAGGDFIIALIVLVTAFVVFVERGQRRSGQLRQAAGRQQDLRRQSSHLPLKINMSGSSPADLRLVADPVRPRWPAGSPRPTPPAWIRDLAGALSPGQPLYILL